MCLGVGILLIVFCLYRGMDFQDDHWMCLCPSSLVLLMAWLQVLIV